MNFYLKILVILIFMFALPFISLWAHAPLDSCIENPFLKNGYELWQKIPLTSETASTGLEKVARPFFGVMKPENKETFFIIGGSKFENGVKTYSDRIFSLQLQFQLSGNKELGACNVTQYTDLRYPFPVAEGLAIPSSQGLICIGGFNGQTHKISTEVYLLTLPLVDTPMHFVKWPDLPIPSSMSCGGIIDNVLYVYEANSLLALNLNALDQGWQILPGIPDGINRQQPAGCVQIADQKKTALFVVGGYNADNGKNSALSDAWKFVPSKDSTASCWTRLSDYQRDNHPLSSVGSIAIPSGCETILLIGGFNLDLWNQRNLEVKSMLPEEFKQKYKDWKPSDYHWNDSVMVLNTITNQWCSLPNPLPVATCGSAVGVLHNQVIVACGEIMPATRTNVIQIGNFERVREFGTLNWCIFIGYLLLMLPFGFFFMKRGKDTKDYFKGGGRIPWWVNGVSIFATMLSSLTFMTIPAMTFISDWRYFPLAITIFAMAPVVIYLYLPFFRRLNITSAYEYLELRFNLFSRVFASLAFIIFMVARSAVVTFLPSLALSVVAGIDLYVSIVLVGSITVIYSTIGGMEAVVWSDFVQAIILIGGALVALVLLVMGSGGIAETVTLASEAQKLNLLDFSWSIAEPVFWITIIGGLVANLSSYTSDQTIVQRYLTTKDEKGASRSIWFNGLLSVGSSALFYAIGTALYTFYKKNPGAFDIVMPSNDSIFPTFIVTELPAGVSGLLIAAIFAATMSTLSSNFNSAATAFVTDFYRRFLVNDEKKAFRMAHITTVVVGTLAIGFALVIASWQNIYSLFDTFQTMIGILTGGLAGLFFMGIFMSRINGIGAIAGLIASYVANIIFKFTDLVPHKPHLLLYGVIGLVACIVVAYIVSMLTGKPPQHKIQNLTLRYPPKSE